MKELFWLRLCGWQWWPLGPHPPGTQRTSPRLAGALAHTWAAYAVLKPSAPPKETEVCGWQSRCWGLSLLVIWKREVSFLLIIKIIHPCCRKLLKYRKKKTLRKQNHSYAQRKQQQLLIMFWYCYVTQGPDRQEMVPSQGVVSEKFNKGVMSKELRASVLNLFGLWAPLDG